MANILTASEAGTVLRTASTDAAMLALLPLVDAYLKNATGHDWAADSPVRPEAKAAAQMLIVMWYENPAMIASGISSLSFGLRAALVQLESIALSYRQFEGINGAGGIALAGVHVGDTVSTVTGIIGVSGDQKANFETVISADGYIQQLSGSDLSSKWYRAYILTPGEL
ncbi:MAG: hypothetical protein CVU46_03110 [Chloroflexi bacterium HGW-Chloroflexi-8]|nr:MAG: hypothetical protein CVU46_03110 [Chloroflexi bacterium HGW-Chloroflexi-8]